MIEQAATRWNSYAALALAGMADGVGIPALIRLAQDPTVRQAGSGDFALRPLAQAAMQYPEAGAALVEQARLNQVPDSAWPTVARSLGGQYLEYGSHILGSTAPPVMWSSEQISHRVALIDQMLAVTSSAAGQEALQNARTTVLSKSPRR